MWKRVRRVMRRLRGAMEGFMLLVAVPLAGGKEGEGDGPSRRSRVGKGRREVATWPR